MALCTKRLLCLKTNRLLHVSRPGTSLNYYALSRFVSSSSSSSSSDLLVGKQKTKSNDDRELTEKEELDKEAEKIALEKLESLRAGVKNGDLDAMVELGDCFRKGRFGIPKEPAVGVEWYRRAAMKGHAGAQYNLALCYFTGSGVAVDDEKCSLLLHEAVKNGHLKAKAHLSQHYLKGLGGTKEDTKKGFELMKECAVAGDPVSQLNVANLYYHGTFDVEKNYKQAAIWFKKAAGRGNPLAARMLGNIYEKGLGVERDSNIALQWYTTAAKIGDAPAQLTLAAIYEYGLDDIPEDRVAGEFWLDKAVAQGFEPAVTYKESKNM